MFTETDIAAIHAAALGVLARTGVLVREPDAVRLLASHGLRSDGPRVYFDEGAVQAALAAAPSSFTLAGRRPELDLLFGEAGAGSARTVFATASGAAFALDGDKVRPAASTTRPHGQARPPIAEHPLQRRQHRGRRPAGGARTRAC